MAEIAINTTLQLFDELLFEKFSGQEKFKVDKVKHQFEEIKSELTMINSFIRNAGARQGKEDRLCLWVKEIEALAYRIEDVFETFVIHVESRNEKSINRILKKIIGVINVKSSATRAFQLEMKDIKKTFTNLQQISDLYQGPVEESSSTAFDYYSCLRDESPWYYPEGEELLVGMDKDIGLLVSSISDESRNYQVISILGMVGIGKTTFARKLYYHDRIQQHFEVLVWVHIHKESSIRTIFERILCHFVGPQKQRNSIEDMSETELVEQLYTFWQKLRCLIVLDNILSRDAWERLRIAFPLGKTASKLLITTRSLEVAQISTAGKGSIYRMRCLTEEDAWKLFTQYVTLREFNTIVSEMDNIERKLVRQCKGPPLGILALGHMFSSKYTLQQRKMRMITQNSTEVFEGMEKLLQALTSIYNDLPHQLKSSLLYLATFQKDTNIKSEKLYHLWMAEGILSLENYQSQTMIHMAEWYLNELHLRGMVYVQEEEVPTAIRIKSCSLHDLIHDFCLFMGRKEEFFVVMGDGLDPDSDSSGWTDRTWRLVIYVGKHDNNKFLVRLTKNLRCLLVRNACINQELDTHETLSKLINFIVQSRFLRILDFDRVDFGNRMLPEGIADLVHLRYLSFMGCLLKALPASIGNLPYLQILDLRVRTGHKMEIPDVLQKMRRLRHLYLPLTFQTCGGVKLRLGGLTQLETLENFNTEECDVEDLFTLTKLWYLTVNTEGSLEDLKSLVDHMNMTSVHVLQSSISVSKFDCYEDERHSIFRQLLACPPLHILFMEGHLGEMPSYRKISKNLTKIVLSGSELRIDPMPTLENLPNLQVLILYDDAFIGKEMICSASKFPELKRLELSNLPELESWRVEVRAMPKLSTLKIENCSQLKMLPDGLGLLTSFRELRILRMPETFKHRLCEVDGKRGADMDKLPCETSIIFDNDNESSG